MRAGSDLTRERLAVQFFDTYSSETLAGMTVRFCQSVPQTLRQRN